MGFSEIIGHAAIIRSFQISLRQGLVAHAHLFSGPEGLGKKLFAFGLAKAVNCLKGNDDFCGCCDSCLRMDKGNHPDIFFLEPDGQSIKIDQMRSFQSSIRYRPFMAKRRVCIIDQAEVMTVSAANALLKTLEEPPGEMMLILITSNLDVILPTIRSRCQVHSFRPLSQDEMTRLLMERLAVPADKVRLLSAFAQGSLKKVQGLELADLLTKRERMMALMELLKTQSIDRFFQEAKQLTEAENPEDLQKFLHLWLYWYYDIWRYQVTASEHLLMNLDCQDQIRRQASLWPRLKIEENIRLVFEACQALQRNANRQLTIEVMFMQLSNQAKR